MKRGDLKIIAKVTGFSESMVYKVKVGQKTNEKITSLITLAGSNRKQFLDVIEGVKEETQVEKRIREVAYN